MSEVQGRLPPCRRGEGGVSAAAPHTPAPHASPAAALSARARRWPLAVPPADAMAHGTSPHGTRHTAPTPRHCRPDRPPRMQPLGHTCDPNRCAAHVLSGGLLWDVEPSGPPSASPSRSDMAAAPAAWEALGCFWEYAWGVDYDVKLKRGTQKGLFRCGGADWVATPTTEKVRAAACAAAGAAAAGHAGGLRTQTHAHMQMHTHTHTRASPHKHMHTLAHARLNTHARPHARPHAPGRRLLPLLPRR